MALIFNIHVNEENPNTPEYSDPLYHNNLYFAMNCAALVTELQRTPWHLVTSHLPPTNELSTAHILKQ